MVSLVGALAIGALGRFCGPKPQSPIQRATQLRDAGQLSAKRKHFSNALLRLEKAKRELEEAHGEEEAKAELEEVERLIEAVQAQIQLKRDGETKVQEEKVKELGPKN